MFRTIAFYGVAVIYILISLSIPATLLGLLIASLLQLHAACEVVWCGEVGIVNLQNFGWSLMVSNGIWVIIILMYPCLRKKTYIWLEILAGLNLIFWCVVAVGFLVTCNSTNHHICWEVVPLLGTTFIFLITAPLTWFLIISPCALLLICFYSPANPVTPTLPVSQKPEVYTPLLAPEPLISPVTE